MGRFARLAKGFPLFVLSPLLCLVSFLALVVSDLLFFVFGKKRKPQDTRPDTTAATVVIPNWNGRDLLEKFIPSVVAALEGNPRNELIVVDNGSSDDSVAFLKSTFPTVKVLALPKNLGFGGGSNAGFRAAKNDIVVLLNSDMRVAPDFLAPLLEGFEDEKVFAVSCQIFFPDPNKIREETGLTQAWWDGGKFGVRHRIDEQVTERFPCFYAGGGSSAYDKRKFFDLGGFDHLLKPFYLEDTDLGMQAWKRGWKIYYQPRSHVWHEHRGTIGRTHKQDYIQTIVQKNFLLFLWKNTHSFPRLVLHFLRTWISASVNYLIASPSDRVTVFALWRASTQFLQAAVSRWKARSLAVVDDYEAYRRPLGGYFHDRFRKHDPSPNQLSILFVSPYAICPPVHGGGVFMYGTTSALAPRSTLHLLTILDEERQIDDHKELVRQCASADFLVRPDQKIFTFGAIQPHAVNEFAHADFDWMMHRIIYQHHVDVIQLEYTNMGQYAGAYQNLAVALFEHDVYFQSISRALIQSGFSLRKTSAGFEYLRALRFELKTLRSVDHVQVCSKENKEYLLEFLPQLNGHVDETLRAGISTSNYKRHSEPREPLTMLFLGSFRHTPNQEALDWFAKQVLPKVVEQCPDAKLVIVGSDPPPRHSLPAHDRNVEIRGFVEDVQEPLHRYAVFVCPILTGSGVRVKLLEAFCTGIPVVSTFIGAEGLTERDGDVCLLSDDPAEFANHIVRLFEEPQAAGEMVQRAYQYVTTERDIVRMTEKLLEVYRRLLTEKRSR